MKEELGDCTLVNSAHFYSTVTSAQLHDLDRVILGLQGQYFRDITYAFGGYVASSENVVEAARSHPTECKHFILLEVEESSYTHFQCR